jgi:phosphoheptose isomerase
MDELALIFSTEHRITLAGVAVDVSPVKLGELARLAPLFKGINIDTEGTPADVALALLTSGNADAVIKAIAIASRTTLEFVEGLALDDAVTLLAAVLEANWDSAKKKLVPVINRVLQAAAPAMAGQTLPPV